MSDISINSGSIENTVSELVSKIQTEIIDAGTSSGNTIISAIENSSGDFIDSLKEEVSSEVDIINSVGELLIAMVNYIQSAAGAFTHVDTTYGVTKIH